jgi:antirestriction protein ArdC
METRLARTFGQRFGDDAYAMEELVAELASACKRCAAPTLRG